MNARASGVSTAYASGSRARSNESTRSQRYNHNDNEDNEDDDDKRQTTMMIPYRPNTRLSH